MKRRVFDFFFLNLLDRYFKRCSETQKRIKVRYIQHDGYYFQCDKGKHIATMKISNAGDEKIWHPDNFPPQVRSNENRRDNRTETERVTPGTTS